MTARAQAIHAIACVVLAIAVLIASLGSALAEVDAADGAKRKRGGNKRGGDLAIVVLADGADPRTVAREMGVEPVRIYSHVFTGFAGDISAVATARSSRSSRVKAIAPDAPMEATGQVVPTGVQRIGQADRGNQPSAEQAGEAKAEKKNKKVKKTKKAKKGKKNSNKKNKGGKNKGNKNKGNKGPKNPGNPGDGETNGTGSVGPGTDVAILDSGVTASGDLHIAGGVSCTESGPACAGKTWTDVTGHGTHVAGIIAAADNDRGVVGIAPDARIWSVRVLSRDENGAAVGWVSDVIAGLDWVYQNRATIDVVNMSLGGWMAKTSSQNGPYQLAIRKVANAGIPVVVAAGNTGQDVLDNGANMHFVPAAYPEAITVSAFGDSDGRPGGTGKKTSCYGDSDDTFWGYSNFGSAIDIAAPGVCILSLLPDGGTVELTGTSMAAPHVAGALALFAADNPDATEAQARNWLLTHASVAQSHPAGFTGDHDRDREPVLFLGP